MEHRPAWRREEKLYARKENYPPPKSSAFGNPRDPIREEFRFRAERVAKRRLATFESCVTVSKRGRTSDTRQNVRNVQRW